MYCKRFSCALATPKPHPHPKIAASAVLAGLRCCQALALAQGLADTDTCPQAPARRRPRIRRTGLVFEMCSK